MNEKTKNIINKVLNIVGYVVIGVLLVLDVFALVSKLSMGNSEGGMNFFGKEVRIVLTGSMNGSDEFYEENPDLEIKRIGVNSAVFIERVPDTKEKQDEFYANLKIGDVLTFNYAIGDGVVVTHRIIDIKESGGRFTYTLRGDNPTGDQKVSKYSPEQYVYSDRTYDTVNDTAVYGSSGSAIGKVTGVSSFLGAILYGFVENKVVLILVVIVPSGLFMCYEIFKIFYYIYKNKKEIQQEELAIQQKEKEEQAQSVLDAKDLELERLKAELEKLKGGNKDDESST